MGNAVLLGNGSYKERATQVPRVRVGRKLTVRSCMKLTLGLDPTRVAPGHPAKGGGGQSAHIPSLLRHPSPSYGPGRVGMDVRIGAYV